MIQKQDFQKIYLCIHYNDSKAGFISAFKKKFDMTSHKGEWLSQVQFTRRNLDLSTNFDTAELENVYSYKYVRLQTHNFDSAK